MSATFNQHVTISSPFNVADLPTLCVWKNRLHRLNGEPEEDLGVFMDEHMTRQNVMTWAAYRDQELGGYFEAATGELSFLTDRSTAPVARVEMTFKREFFKHRPEKDNGASAGGQEVTGSALNLVLRELFEEYELVFFPMSKTNRPIAMLVMSVGAAKVGLVDETVNLFVLSRLEWERTNAAFIAAMEKVYPLQVGEDNTLRIS